MWVYNGNCALGDSWAESFMAELEEVTQFRIDKGDFNPDDPNDCFYEALNEWGEREFMYYSDQDAFISDVGLQTCIDLIKESQINSMEYVDDGIKFCIFACESAFYQCISWEDDEEDDSVEESIRSRRARKSMLESRRSANHRGRARRIR